MPKLKATLALALLAFLSGCAVDVRTDEPEPKCNPNGPDVVVIVAPEAIEIPECTETAVDEPELNVGHRQWCCWKSKAPSIQEIAAREAAK